VINQPNLTVAAVVGCTSLSHSVSLSLSCVCMSHTWEAKVVAEGGCKAPNGC